MAGSSGRTWPIPARKRVKALLNHITRPTVAMRPERALGADGPIRVIRSLLVRTADDTIRHYNRLGPATLYELKDLEAYCWIGANVSVFDEPPLNVRIAILFGDNTNRYFAGSLIIRSVERDSGNWVAPKTMASLLFE